MDIAGGMINLQRADLMARVQFAAARKVMQAGKEQGDAALKLLRSATSGVDRAATHLGRNVNVLA